MTRAFTKVVRLGRTADAGDVYCKIEYSAEGRLSVTGVEGPRRNGNMRGSAGQIVATLRERGVEHITPAPGWTHDRMCGFLRLWDAWHLNDMRAGCEHQRSEGWADRPIDPTKPTRAYGKHFPGQRQDSWNMLVWVWRSEHPEGLLAFPCPTCGYKYGTQWLKQDVPDDVLEWLRTLPDSDITPAWV